MGTHLGARERHLPYYELTQYYLPPDTGERAPPYPQPGRLVLDLLSPEGRKAELTFVVARIPRWFSCRQTVTHPGSNRARRRATTWLSTRPCHQLCLHYTRRHIHSRSRRFNCLLLISRPAEGRRLSELCSVCRCAVWNCV